ncbi:MAG: RNA 2',3'-cyclic phosphodiesterase [Alphaproteobacteria bacterium]|nr:RNA 2',3'-cyclic phosphodiesterase [Alphaproteobacteria bacterium]
MYRLFVAIELPAAIRQALAALAEGLPGARWIEPENLHLTLRFIGEVDGGMAEDIAEALSLVSAPVFPLRLAGVGHFSTGERARILWVGVERSAEMKQLYTSVSGALRRVGVAPEGRKFSPHVSLARLKDAHLEDVERFIAGQSLFRVAAFPVGYFTLFSSFLSKSGAIHTPEVEFSLARV